MTAILNQVADITKCVAYQVEKSGIITMLGYVGLVYACLVDLLIFHDLLNWLEWVGLSVITLTTIMITTHLLRTKNRAN